MQAFLRPLFQESSPTHSCFDCHADDPACSSIFCNNGFAFCNHDNGYGDCAQCHILAGISPLRRVYLLPQHCKRPRNCTGSRKIALMLHYIYTRSFIGIITFMALALVAWGALPARVGARRWRRADLALFVAVTLISKPVFAHISLDTYPKIIFWAAISCLIIVPLFFAVASLFDRKTYGYAKELVTPYIKNIFNKIHIGHSKNI